MDITFTLHDNYAGPLTRALADGGREAGNGDTHQATTIAELAQYLCEYAAEVATHPRSHHVQAMRDVLIEGGFVVP